ncbi:TetR/AcrR family transcriptional regulator [Williamsia sp. 1135]|uniref:TetR/AcrR family transcriptional regulator n=1 Tax=Williamsia sp. 1135 TaxID=1889262 RepID=UPI000A11D640|nr:TetR/AcrR family transcriptional regulator [Williamsia sp. 1135]ORM34131.1 TetR family transcriptional regulator [Williamsia sp. 1135]
MKSVTTEKVLRRDAAENRQRLLDAAAAVFSERGLEVGVDEIARRAGVGTGTLYRRFPTKEALISELVRQVFIDFVDAAHAAQTAPRGEGLEQLMYGVGTIQATNRGCLSRVWNDDETAAHKREFRTILAELLDTAKSHGRVRGDVGLTDIDVIFWAMRGVVETTRGITDSGWRRALAIMFAGLRPGGEHLDATPVTEDEFAQVVARLNPR